MYLNMYFEYVSDYLLHQITKKTELRKTVEHLNKIYDRNTNKYPNYGIIIYFITKIVFTVIVQIFVDCHYKSL